MHPNRGSIARKHTVIHPIAWNWKTNGKTQNPIAEVWECTPTTHHSHAATHWVAWAHTNQNSEALSFQTAPIYERIRGPNSRARNSPKHHKMTRVTMHKCTMQECCRTVGKWAQQRQFPWGLSKWRMWAIPDCLNSQFFKQVPQCCKLVIRRHADKTIERTGAKPKGPNFTFVSSVKIKS